MHLLRAWCEAVVKAWRQEKNEFIPPPPASSIRILPPVSMASIEANSLLITYQVLGQACKVEAVVYTYHGMTLRRSFPFFSAVSTFQRIIA